MSTANDISSTIDTIFNTAWSERDGTVVPNTEDVALLNGAVKLDAVFLYADLADSTALVRTFSQSMAAKIIRAYLASMTRLIRHHDGEIRSFDGDRVMGVFVGDSKNSNAAKCALEMEHVVTKVLRPKAEAKFPSLTEKGFVIRHGVGIHSSKVTVVRAGIRGHNDLVFVGSAPNLAAKLSDIRDGSYRINITHVVYKKLNKDAKFSRGTGEDMWVAVKRKLGGETWACYKSSWRRSP